MIIYGANFGENMRNLGCGIDFEENQSSVADPGFVKDGVVALFHERIMQ